ncbi:MAG: hypothetical protein ABI992_00965 [Chthoniobacterales bacterium]
MPTKSKSSETSGVFLLRAALAAALVFASALLGFLALAASPTGGTISPAGPNLTWTGTAPGVPPTGGAEDACTEGSNCDSYTLTISGNPSDWAAAGKQVHVQINWNLPATDYDLYVHKGGLTGPIVASSGSAGTTREQVDLNPASSSVGTGIFTVHVVYYINSGTDQYGGTATVVSAGSPPLPAPTPSGGFRQRFENFNPPAAGPTTLGRSSGEPSIGVTLPFAGHPEGHAMFQSDVQTLRVTFNASCALPLWENRPAPTSQEDFDPILFTDFTTGRTIAHLLSFAGQVVAGESSYTDGAAPFSDGEVWVPSHGTGILSGIDHQTVGGGPYRTDLTAIPPVVPPPHPLYANAVYYCSQALVDASCARSDDGGLNYGASVVIYTDQCGGLHGHVKVSPDGVVYVPNKGCGTSQGVVVSEDNGVTWNVRTVPGSTSSGSDPSVGIGSAGKVYFGYADGDTKAAIAVSNNHGVTWSQPLDVGAAFGINNVAFPVVLAGDDNRASMAFLGTPTAGGLQGPRFAGIWHLYVATTLDGGSTWSTVDATPNSAVQRGCIWQGGGSNICRNLLDFIDVSMDHQGRVLVGYADGCAGGECKQASPFATGNSYTALASIARQSGGPRLLSAFDPPAVATAPGLPSLNGRRNGTVVHLSWSLADDGGTSVTGYNIFRGTVSGGEALLASVPGSQLRYDDATAGNTATTYYYKVTAANSVGSSCDGNELALPYVGNTLTGFTVAADPTGDQTTPTDTDLDIQSLNLSEPASGPYTGKLVFKLKVADLSAPQNLRMWRIVWDSPSAPGGQFYVGMTRDQAGVVTYDYGTVTTAVVGLVLGVPTTTRVGDPDFGGFTPDGTITIVVSKDKIGNPRTGDVLGAFSVRTYDVVNDMIRSTNAIDTTSNANANDTTANAAAYTLTGPIPGLNSAVSRKTHGAAGTFDINLPLTGTPGVECRSNGSNTHQVVFRFDGPAAISSATVTPGLSGTGIISSTSTNGNELTVNLANVSDQQTLMINLLGASVNGTTANISIPMTILAGDSTGNSSVNSSDVSEAKSQSGQVATGANFRDDVTANGVINSSDVSLIKANSGHGVSAPQTAQGEGR